MIAWKESFSCNAHAPRKLNMALGIEKKARFYYNGHQIFKDKPEITVSNCGSTSSTGQYLMVATGIQNLVLNNQIGSYSYNDQLSARGDRCRIENLPFPKQDPKERKEKLFERREVINHCVTVQVTDFSEAGIQYPTEQRGCHITKVSKNSVDVKGPYCFFSPTKQSNYSIHFEADPKCLDKEYLKYNNIALQDINLMLNTYIAGDYTGRSPDLTAISTTPTRFSLNPLPNIISISDDFGLLRPTWPSFWMAGNVELGNLEVQNYSPHFDHINLPLLVDTRCERTCSKETNICTSACDYSQAIVGRYNLYEWYQGKFEYLKTWYDGSAAPANYQGLLYGSGLEIKKGIFQKDRRYKIEVEFDEPDLSFAHYDGRVKEQLRLNPNHIVEMRRNGGLINEIPIFNVIRDTEVIPNLDPISNIDFDSPGISRLLKNAVGQLQNYLDNSYWPPYFEKVCEPLSKKCHPIGKGKITLSLEFLIEENQEEGGYKIIRPMISRKGNLGKTYRLKKQPKYKINCRRRRNNR